MGAYDPVPVRGNSQRKDLYDFFFTGDHNPPQSTEEAEKTYSHSGYVRIGRTGIHSGDYKSVAYKFLNPLDGIMHGEPVHTDPSEFPKYYPWVPTNEDTSHSQLLPPDFPRKIINKK